MSGFWRGLGQARRRRPGTEPDVRESPQRDPQPRPSGTARPLLLPCPCPRGAPSALSQLSKDIHNSENYPPALRDDTVTNRSESNSVSPKLHGQAQLLSRWTLCGEGPARTAGETGGFSLVGGRLAAADQETR